MNDNNKEGLYVYGSGEMDQLSPIKEEEKYSEIYDTKIPLKIPLHFISEKEKISKIKCGQMFTMILSIKGNVYTFGCADNGGIGHEDSIPAKKVDLNFKAIDISGGDCHGIAYNNTNLAFWGQIRNSQGCIGEPFLNIKYYNISDINNEKIKKAISGTNHVIILTEERKKEDENKGKEDQKEEEDKKVEDKIEDIKEGNITSLDETKKERNLIAMTMDEDKKKSIFGEKKSNNVIMSSENTLPTNGANTNSSYSFIKKLKIKPKGVVRNKKDNIFTNETTT